MNDRTKAKEGIEGNGPRSDQKSREGSLQLTRTEAVILELLDGPRELFGLEMVESSDGRLRRGTVYVLLSRLSDKGFVESRLEPRPEGEAGIPRRLYRVTGLGQRALQVHQRIAAMMAEAFA